MAGKTTTPLVKASNKSNRLAQLVALRKTLAEAIDTCDSNRDLASLARQYRETIKEIEDLEEPEVSNDGIGDILSARKADGKSAANRKGRTKV